MDISATIELLASEILELAKTFVAKMSQVAEMFTAESSFAKMCLVVKMSMAQMSEAQKL